MLILPAMELIRLVVSYYELLLVGLNVPPAVFVSVYWPELCELVDWSSACYFRQAIFLLTVVSLEEVGFYHLSLLSFGSDLLSDLPFEQNLEVAALVVGSNPVVDLWGWLLWLPHLVDLVVSPVKIGLPDWCCRLLYLSGSGFAAIDRVNVTT